MSRVSVEENIWAKLPRISRMCKLDEDLILGKLIRLWHYSQEEGVVCADFAQIMEYCFMLEHTESQKSLFFSALIRLKLLISTDDDMYQIKGNQKHIDSLSAYKNRTKKATEVRMKKISRVKETDVNVDVTKRVADVNVTQYNTIQDNTILTKDKDRIGANAPRIVFDFESIYKSYPKKEGKKRGLVSCRSQIKTQSDYDRLKKSINNYQLKIKHEKTELKYIKQFSSFMNCWTDFEDWVFVEEENSLTALGRRIGAIK